MRYVSLSDDLIFRFVCLNALHVRHNFQSFRDVFLSSRVEPVPFSLFAMFFYTSITTVTDITVAISDNLLNVLTGDKRHFIEISIDSVRYKATQDNALNQHLANANKTALTKCTLMKTL